MSRNNRAAIIAIVSVLVVCLVGCGLFASGLIEFGDKDASKGGENNQGNANTVVADVSEYKSGVSEIAVTNVAADGKSAYSQQVVGVGDTVVYTTAKGLKVANTVKTYDGATGIVVFNDEKPAVEEIFDTLKVNSTDQLNQNSDVALKEDIAAAAESSAFAQAIATSFNVKPSFSGDIFKNEDGSIHVELTITVPGVVKIGDLTTDLVISLIDNVSATADTKVDVKDGKSAYDLSLAVNNAITCKVALKQGYSYSSITNVNEIIAKLQQISNDADEVNDGIEIPAFVWTVPIANGAASISYEAAVVLRFAFEGAFEVVANADLNFVTTMSYNSADGFIADTNTVDSGMKSVEIKIDGSVKVKTGLSQQLTFDILGGVLSAGVKAELGLYNNLYGSMQTSNLLEENATVSGGVYLEGGFYYDVDLVLAVAIGSVINTGKNIDIVAGEKELYNAGERYLTVDTIVEDEYKLAAYSAPYMNILLKKYDLITRTFSYETVAAEAIAADASVTAIGFENGKMLIADGSKNSTFEVPVTISYDKFVKNSNLVYCGDFIVLDGALSFAKPSKEAVVINVAGNKVNEGTITLKDANGNAIASEYSNGVITIGAKTLSVLPNGEYVITVSNGQYSADVVLTVSGTLLYTDWLTADGAYDVFTSDQLLDLIANGGSLSGKTVEITADIDLNGATVAPIALFEGVINGNNNTIGNYTVSAIAEDLYLGFIIKNNGTIKDLTFAGTVTFEKYGRTGKTYYVAGVAALNYGVIENVHFAGVLNMTETGGSVNIDVYCGGVVAGTNIEGCESADATFNLAVKYQTRILEVMYDGTVKTVNVAENRAVTIAAEFKAY